MNPRLIIGLENNYNSCYLNSVLQLLLNISQLNITLRKEINGKPTNNETLLLYAYRNILENIYIDTKEDIVDNYNILESDQFKNVLNKIMKGNIGMYQHDTHEILISILDIFHEGLKCSIRENTLNKCEDKIRNVASVKWVQEQNKQKYSIINKLFRGQLRTKITCLQCFTEDNIFESFIDIGITMTSEKLENCLKSFCCIEELDEKRSCKRCKRKTEATKEVTFCRLPQYLIININRFNEKNGILSKNKKDIQFPLENLEMKCFSGIPSDVVKYNINSIILHHGNKIDYGHYTTIISRRKKWYHINDEDIKEIENPYLEKGNTYILVYEIST